MVHRNGLVKAAAIAALACAGMVRAGDAMPDDGLSLRPLFLQVTSQPAAPQSTQPAVFVPGAVPTPIMYALTKAGLVTPLTNANITISGYIDGGYTASFQQQPGNVIPGRFQDTKNEHVVLDQADIFFDRPVDYAGAATKKIIDFGGHAEFIYGWDTGVFHSSGIFDNPAVAGTTGGPNGNTTYSSRTQPENQADIVQAYVDFGLPLGAGTRVRIGKFVTLLGWEYINPTPTSNALYSHSFLFTYAIPLTQTGVIGEYKFNADFTADYGITRGWSQSLRDNNGSADFLGNITWTPQESLFLQSCKVVLGLSEGPQGTHDNHDYWTVLDLQASYQMYGDGKSPGSLLVALNSDYGDAPHSGQWYGVATYAQYIATSNFTFNARLEWYDDAKGFTTGYGTNVNLYEATFGVQIRPFLDDIGSNLTIRPEVRFDYADKDFFIGGTKKYQATFGIDAVFVI